MKQPARFWIVLAGMAFLGSCRDFVTKKITNDSINVLAPANNTVTTSNSVTFWWDALDGADSYNLQIVKPNFAAAQALIADTNVSSNKLQLSLTPGTYQWRIKGVNGGGSSKYTVFNLTIDTTSNLSSQLVVPIGPAAAFVTGNASITFSWNAINAADKYEIQINTNPAIDFTGPGTSFTSTFAPGTYTWKVKALNAFSISQYNTTRSFKIDQTAPSPPNNLLATMSNSFNIKVTDTLKWHRVSSDVNNDSVYIYGDAAYSSITGAGKALISKVTISDFLSAPSGTPSVPYWWRVKSIDSVGNRSSFSAGASFTLTP